MGMDVYTKGVKTIIRGVIVFGFVVYGEMVVFMERLKLTSVLIVYNNDNDVKSNGYEEREKLLLEDNDNKELHV